MDWNAPLLRLASSATGFSIQLCFATSKRDVHALCLDAAMFRLRARLRW